MAVHGPYHVLFLCTGNSARSIIAEAILNRVGAERFVAYSAGSHPKGRVHPYAVDLLKKLNHPTADLHSKSWSAFAATDAPRLDFVFTVCDNAANEVCPVWAGQPMTAHWGIPDPAAAEGSESERRLAFAEAYRQLTNRIDIFINLPLRSLDKLTLQKRLDEIGQRMPEAARGGRMTITIYHNPSCGTSRNVLALIRNSGEEPRIVEYLKTPPTRAELASLIERMDIPVREVLRRKGTPYDELGLDAPDWTDDQLIDEMIAHPILINRPIVVTPMGVKLCRPSEAVLDILTNPQQGALAKEDGERVVDAEGKRLA